MKKIKYKILIMISTFLLKRYLKHRLETNDNAEKKFYLSHCLIWIIYRNQYIKKLKALNEN